MSMPVVSTMRRTTSRIGSPTTARSTRSSAESRPKRSRASGEYAASPGSSSASERAAVSAGSMPSAIAVSSSVIETVASARARRPAISAARSPSSRRSRGPIAQRGTGEQGEQGGVGGDVVQQGQHRDDLGHLGQPQQARRGRRSRPGSPAAVSASKTASAVELSRVRTPRSDHAVGVRRLHLLDQPGQLVVGRGEDLGRHRAGRSLADVSGATSGRAAYSGSARRLATSRMRRSERRLTVSGSTGTPPEAAGKVSVEVEDVGDRGAAPAVDRLVGVADRGDGVTAALLGGRAGEQPGEHLGLGDRGVLVLVEHHDPELRRAPGPRPRAARRPAGRRARSGRRSPSARGRP